LVKAQVRAIFAFDPICTSKWDVAVLPNTPDLKERRNQAVSVLAFVVRNSGATRGNLIGASTRNLVVRGLTNAEFAKTHLGMRQSSVRQRWSALVALAAVKPNSLGFVSVSDGVVGIAEEMRCDPSTVFRNLKTWSEKVPPLVEVGFVKKPKRQPQVALLQIPILTEWLLFTAAARGAKEAGLLNAARFEQIRELTGLYIAQGIPPPQTGGVLTWQEAQTLIDQAKQLDQGSQRRNRKRR
tara:strand:- start:49 stop:768 length:720 start_codon:yes stop_codon:yes gene_type:complete